jgi:hypothetical protein
MWPTSTLCRTQAARQRDIAAAAKLDNVRMVASAAAAAWDKEAVWAELRESRKDRTATLRQQAALAAPAIDRMDAAQA